MVGIVDIIIIEEEGAVVEIIIIMELLGCWLDYGGKSQAMADAEMLPTGEPSRPLLPAGRPLLSLYDDGAEVVSTEMFANVAGLRTDRRWGTLSGLLLSSSCQSVARRCCWRDRRDWQLLLLLLLTLTRRRRQ